MTRLEEIRTRLDGLTANNAKAWATFNVYAPGDMQLLLTLADAAVRHHQFDSYYQGCGLCRALVPLVAEDPPAEAQR